MGRNDQLRLIVSLLVIFVIFFSILTVGLIYRDDIYNFLSINSSEEYKYKAPAPIPISTQSPTQPPTQTPTEVIHNDTNLPTGVSVSATAPTKEPPTEPPTEPENSPFPAGYIEAPKSELMQAMFDNAIEIPGTSDIIELPPDGRDIELQYAAVPLSDWIPEPFAYFKNVIFLGDSVTTGFEQFKTKIKFNGEDVMKDTTVIAVGSYGIFNALSTISDKTIHPLMNGKQTMPEDIIATKEAKNVFICLGLNDLTWSKPESYIAAYAKLIDRIKEKSPDKNVVIMSITPVIFGHKNGSLTNDLIMAANNNLLKFAQENGIMFIDYGAAIRNEQNCLYDELSSDKYCHLTYAAYNRLIEYMLHHPIKD
jgi:lysophospholipase L1-like esterase